MKGGFGQLASLGGLDSPRQAFHIVVFGCRKRRPNDAETSQEAAIVWITIITYQHSQRVWFVSHNKSISLFSNMIFSSLRQSITTNKK